MDQSRLLNTNNNSVKVAKVAKLAMMAKRKFLKPPAGTKDGRRPVSGIRPASGFKIHRRQSINEKNQKQGKRRKKQPKSSEIYQIKEEEEEIAEEEEDLGKTQLMQISFAEFFSEEQLEEFRESFNLFDKENEKRIHGKDLGTVLRSLGLHPTEAECADLLSTVETEGTGKIEFGDFCGILARTIKDSDPETELTEAFKVFDKNNTGYISNADLRRIVTTYGEVLTDEEVDEMIRDADTDGDGMVDYAEFVSIVTSEMRRTGLTETS